MKKARNVESFNLDHTKVVAPYIRCAGVKTGPVGDIVSKYDVRFTQPNVEYLPMEAMHTLEHLVAEYIRDELSGVIDFSPMGCQTGFYLTVFGKFSEKEITDHLVSVLTKVSQWDDAEAVPGVDPVMCGNWKGHSLAEAKKWAAQWVSGITEKGYEAFPVN